MTTSCPQCRNTTFELKISYPEGSNTKINVIQCKECGSPIGILENPTVHTQLENLEYQLTLLSRKLDQIINNQIYTITQKVTSIESGLYDVRYQLGNR